MQVQAEQAWTTFTLEEQCGPSCLRRLVNSSHYSASIAAYRRSKKYCCAQNYGARAKIESETAVRSRWGRVLHLLLHVRLSQAVHRRNLSRAGVLRIRAQSCAG